MSKQISDLAGMNATDLAAAIRTKQVSCWEVMQAFLMQINKFNHKVNAIVSLQDSGDLLRQADECDRQLALQGRAGCSEVCT